MLQATFEKKSFSIPQKKKKKKKQKKPEYCLKDAREKP